MAFNTPSIVSTGLAGLPQIYYDKVAFESFTGNTPWTEICTFRTLPPNSGRNIQFYGTENLPASNSTLAEGVPPSPLSLTEVLSNLFLDYFGDFLTISD